MKDNNNLRMTLKAALDNLWSRISGIFGTVNGRIDDAEDRIDDIETDVSGVTSRVAGVETRMTTAEGQITGLDSRVDDIEDAMDDLEGDMIKSISLNGVNVPKDAQGNVALQETDPTVPSWAKQVKAKTSDFTNDGADGVHPYISQGDVTVPTKTSDLLNDGDDGTTYYVTWRQLSDSKDQAFIDENYIELTQDNIRREFTKDEHYQGEAFFMYASPAGLTAMLPNGSQYTRYTNCTFRGLVYTSKQYMTLDDYNMVGWMEGPGIHELVTGYIDTDWSGEDPTIYITEITQIGGGGGSGGDVNIIEAISFNGTNVPPDAGKRVSLTETDPTVPTWAKQSSKPSYTAQEVGALPANTPIPSKTSDLTNDSGFLTSSTGVSGVKGNAESSYRTGDVNITPANIGAVSKAGDTMTGDLTVNAETPQLILKNNTYVSGQTPSKNLWNVAASSHDKNGQRVGSIHQRFYPNGDSSLEMVLEKSVNGTSYYGGFKVIGSMTSTNENQLLYNADTKSLTGGKWQGDAIGIEYGGTGATTAAVTITNNYSSVQNVINAVKDTRSFPISIQKNGTASYSDMPSGYETAEWNMMLIGDSTRLTALMFIFFNLPSESANQVFSRHFYNGTWSAWTAGWSQIK